MSRLIYLILGLNALIIGFIFDIAVPRLVENRTINFYGFYDYSPSFFYTLGLLLFIISMSNQMTRKIMNWVIIIGTSAMLLLEFAQFWIVKMTADLADVIAIFVASVLVYLITFFTKYKYKDH